MCRLSFAVSSALASCLLFSCNSGEDPDTASDIGVYYVEAAAGGWVCEDPDGFGNDILDIGAVIAERAGDSVLFTIGFFGDIEQYNEQTEEKLQISLQVWLGDEYVEALFSDKTTMKVVDGKAGVEYEIDGNVIRILLTGLSFDLMTRFVANSIVSGYPDYDGLCIDELGTDTSDPDAQTPVDLPGIIDDPNNVDPPPMPEGPRFIMLTDLSPTTSGDFPGSDIDRIEVCKSVNSDCVVADIVAEESSGVLNSAGLTQVGGSEACTTESFTSLAGGYVIATFSDPTVEIEEGDSIRVFGLPELLCEAAGPNAEQTFEVSVGDTNIVEQFNLVGTCETTIPCRLTVPAGT